MSLINQQLKKAILVSLLGRYTAYIVQLALLMLYARWFTPDEFGILAAMQVFVVFFMMLGEVGLGPGLINLRQLSNEDRDGLFSITWIIGLVIAIVFYFVTFLLNDFYVRNDYHILGLPICLSVLFNAASTLPIAFLQRERRFISLAKADVFAELIALPVVWGFMKYGFTLHALAVRPLAVSIVRYIVNYLSSKTTEFGKASFGCKFSAIKPLLGFSGYQFAFNFINYFSRNLDNILVGRILGMGPLGIYDKAYSLMKYPLMLLSFAVTPAIQPVLAQHAHDLELMEKTHAGFVKKVSFLGVLAGLMMGASSNEIVYILLGPQWNAVGPVLQILSVTIPVQVILSTSGGFYQALNRTDLMFKCGVFSSITNVIAIIAGIYFGSLERLALCLFVSFHLNFIQCYFVMYREAFKQSIKSFINELIPAFLLLLVGLTLWSGSCLLHLDTLNVWFTVAFNSCVIAISGLISLFILRNFKFLSKLNL